ncbi:hypothetical protein TNCV_572601 [Trichonephila clavipes]|nr:hypothetical protein TNCV_572601 [Trichonephila clavipes]
MPSIIDSHDMGLRTVYSPDARKKTPIQRRADASSGLEEKKKSFATWNISRISAVTLSIDENILRLLKSSSYDNRTSLLRLPNICFHLIRLGSSKEISSTSHKLSAYIKASSTNSSGFASNTVDIEFRLALKTAEIRSKVAW